MKRFIAVFGVIVIITMHCLSFYPAKAAINSVDYGEMLNIYLGAAETALAASQGVTIDWSNMDLPTGSENWTDQQKAQYVVSYVGNLKNAGLRFWYDFLFGEDLNPSFDVISTETAAIGLNSSKNINTLDIKAQLDNILATQSQDHVFQTYSDKVIAKWNEYNTNYINDYLAQMNYSEQELPIPAPDATYFNDYYHYIPTTSRPNWATFDDNSYYLFSQSMGNNLFYGEFICVSGGALYINWDNVSGYWTISCSGNPSSVYNDGNYLYSSIYNGTYQGPYTISSNLSDYNIQSWLNNRIRDQIKLIPNDLNNILNYAAKIARNIPVYINGQLYSTLPIDNDLSFSLPDAVIDNSTDDGKIVAHPIYYPDTMNTDKALNIDLDKVVDAIASRIALGDTDITFDDLVDAGAAVKLDGTTLTDADTVVKDVSIPIARARVDTIDGVIPTIDIVPPLPPLPPLTPGDYSGEGFNGMSVLARIINATVQGLPEPLILTFFGVIFGAVILGIIKILHH